MGQYGDKEGLKFTTYFTEKRGVLGTCIERTTGVGLVDDG